MAETAKQQEIRRYAIVAVAMLVACIAAADVTLVVRDRNEKELLSQLDRSQSELRMLGGRIASVKDADLASTNDFISAYAQIEPREKEYDLKLQQFSELYERARERDGHRGWLDLERLRGRHHPEAWEKMSEIIGLVREINEVTKDEIVKTIEFASETGMPQYDSSSRKVYVNLRNTNEVAEIDPATDTLSGKYPVDGCQFNHGMAIDSEHQRAFLLCSGNRTFTVFALNTHKSIAHLPMAAGADVVKFDPGLRRIYVLARAVSFPCSKRRTQTTIKNSRISQSRKWCTAPPSIWPPTAFTHRSRRSAGRPSPGWSYTRR
jgi:hypothetical protein